MSFHEGVLLLYFISEPRNLTLPEEGLALTREMAKDRTV